MAGVALTNAERQRRYRERCAAREPVRTVAVARTPKDRRPRPKRWTDAVDQLRTLQAEYQAWRDGLPDSLAHSRTAELLEGVCDVDMAAFDVDLPRDLESAPHIMIGSNTEYDGKLKSLVVSAGCALALLLARTARWLRSVGSSSS